MKTSKLIWLLCGIIHFSTIVHGKAQLWKQADNTVLRAVDGTREIEPNKYQLFELDQEIYFDLIKGAPLESTVRLSDGLLIDIPMPDGKVEQFRVVEYQMIEKALADKYPTFKTYKGISVNDPLKRIRFDWTERGFRGMITDGGKRVFIDPVFRENQTLYQSYHKSDYEKKGAFECGVQDNKHLEVPEGNQRVSGDCMFRSYRLAVATTGEYSNYFNVTDDSGEGTILSEVMTAVDRVNDVYEADVAIRLILIAATVDVFYYDGTTDPYSNGSGTTMLGQNQTTCNNVIGSANYDIGHVFSTGGGGVATLFSPCNNSTKARGVTGQPAPINDPFYIDYVAHEMGHQFGGNHTQNNPCNRNGSTAMEPGSASTIMGYAGICSPNVQSNSDAYFHGISVQEINNFITGSGNSCATPLTFSNNSPVVAPIANYTIPISTPFMLTADATDADNDPLTYCWEQWDNESGIHPPQSTNLVGPMFRTFFPEPSPTRYFPRLSDLVNNTSFDWEELPSVSRNMEFRVTVRDWNGDAGCTDEANMTVTTSALAGPFTITSPGAGVVWLENDVVTIDWDVANTDLAPVSCANVDILYSTDGGFTYPVTLASGVTNDGSHDIVVPMGITDSARVMVKCSDNIFFDISDDNIEVQIGVPDFAMMATNADQTVCDEINIDYIVDINSILGYNEAVTLSLSNLPSGADAEISPNPIIPGNQATITISKLNNVVAGNYTMTLTGTSLSGIKNIDLTLSKPNTPGVATLDAPIDQAIDISTQPLFDWSDVLFASRYTLQVADNIGFTNAEEFTNIEVSTFQYPNLLLPDVDYFWRVKSINDCFEGGWSLTSEFRTRTCFTIASTDVPVDIASGPPNTVTSLLNIPSIGNIDDINISIVGNHTWIRDLTFTLTSPTNTVVTLLDRICSNQNNFDIIFDDEAPNNNYPCPPTDGQAYQPEEPLSGFDNTAANGDWTLTIIDNAGQDGGALTAWNMEVCLTDACQLLVDKTSGNSTGSLAAAIECASSGDTILFDALLAGDTVFVDGAILLDKDIYLVNENANKVTLASSTSSRLFEVGLGAILGMNNLDVLGDSPLAGGAFSNDGTILLVDTNVKRWNQNQNEPLVLNNGSIEVFGNCQIEE